jgi:hypothetical protein
VLGTELDRTRALGGAAAIRIGNVWRAGLSPPVCGPRTAEILRDAQGAAPWGGLLAQVRIMRASLHGVVTGKARAQREQLAPGHGPWESST